MFAPALSKIASIKKSNPGNLAVADFDFDYFASLSSADKKELLAIVNSGVQNADSGMGCYAMNPSDYDKFEPFFGAVISDYHKVPRSANHVTDWKLDGVAGLPADGKLDVTKLGLPPVSMRVRVGRNLADFPLPGAMNKDDRVAMEAKMQIAFKELKKKYGGRYHSLTPGNPDFINDDEYAALVKAHVMFKDMVSSCCFFWALLHFFPFFFVFVQLHRALSLSRSLSHPGRQLGLKCVASVSCHRLSLGCASIHI